MDRYLHQNLAKAREQRRAAAVIKAEIAAAQRTVKGNLEKEVSCNERILPAGDVSTDPRL